MRAELRGACKNPGDRVRKKLHIDLSIALGVTPETEVGDHLFGISTVLLYFFDVLRQDHIGFGARGLLPAGREQGEPGTRSAWSVTGTASKKC